ncbi:MAG TPA: hypothetical protein VGE18_02450 [Candidatus Paceibacterota bacterium]
MSFFTHKAKYLVLGILFIAFIWISGFGILSAAQMSHGEHQAGCTITLGEHVICAMDPFEYLSVWQSIFTVPPILIASFLLLVIAFGLALYTRIKKVILDPPRITSSQEVFRRLTFCIPDLYTELFSQGILHPKAP